MDRLLIALLFALASVGTGGCIVQPLIHVFNNSRDPIIVRVGQDEHVAQPSESISFVYKNDELAVEFRGSQVDYLISPPASEYIRTGLFRAHITLQIEPDRRVFVLKACDAPPIEAASYAQPNGYPLGPIADSGS